MSTHALYPGSFDPITSGHLDIFRRSARLFDRLTIAVVHNVEKKGLFSHEERVALIAAEVADLPNVAVTSFTGLLVDFVTENGVGALVKGLRGAADLEGETVYAHWNRHLAGVETVWLPAAPELSFVSSSMVKQVASLGGDVDAFVPAGVAAALKAKFGNTP